MLRCSWYKDEWVLEPNSSEYGSDNSSAAENQQERLVRIGWITGFVDGEGCFSIHFVRQAERLGRRGYRTGYQVAHEFAVTQGAKSVKCLHALRLRCIGTADTTTIKTICIDSVLCEETI